MNTNGADGGCLCGAVRFEVDFPTRWVAHCHCSMCRRAHGAAFVTWVSVPQAQFRLHDPEQRFTTYQSSAHASRGFCARCGTTFLFRSSRWPGEVHLTRANFRTPPDKAPQIHAYYDTHVEWFSVNDELRKKPAPDQV